jgi:hypothetical protein
LISSHFSFFQYILFPASVQQKRTRRTARPFFVTQEIAVHFFSGVWYNPVRKPIVGKLNGAKGGNA